VLLPKSLADLEADLATEDFVGSVVEVEEEVEVALRRARTIVLIPFYNKRPIVAAAARVGHQPGTPLHQSHGNMNLELTSQPAARLAPFYQTEFSQINQICTFQLKKAVLLKFAAAPCKPATMVNP